MRSQYISVDPRARATRSHLLESTRNRGCSEVVHTGKNQGRSMTGNVFNRLGRGVDMRETLNRRREQERSQHSIDQKVQTEANSQGMRNIPLEICDV